MKFPCFKQVDFNSDYNFNVVLQLVVLLFIEAVYICLERVFECENDLVIKSIVITADYFSYVPY